jgi:hypothetical protein
MTLFFFESLHLESMDFEGFLTLLRYSQELGFDDNHLTDIWV